jgi:iron complex outermembrane receptor protein
VFVATTLNWQISPQLKLTAGIDNLLDQQAYVFHPWPGRTYHFQARYQIGG